MIQKQTKYECGQCSYHYFITFNLLHTNYIMDPEPEPKNKNKVKIVAMSDTHDFHKLIKPEYLPDADIFIHAGDFTQYSRKKQHARFIQFIQSLPYKHKVVIAGNHDFALDKQIYETKYKNTKHKDNPVNTQQEIQKLKEVCTYLQHEMVEIEGLKIFGSPYTPEFYDWGFMYKHEDGQKIWSSIPQETDILVTHGPPFGILDKTNFGPNAGCKGLLDRIEKVKPKVHIFGHIHEGFGHKQIEGVRYYNVSNVNFNYNMVNPETVIDVQVDKID